MISSEQIKNAMFKGIFDRPIMDNTFRGYWCEYMLAEAIGEECRHVGEGWHAWDMQLGEDTQDFPDRIRVQVKNSAARQIWHTDKDSTSKCQWMLSYRKRPDYLGMDGVQIPCEKQGFMCDIFILCLHDRSDDHADQRDPHQWKFYLVPVIGPNTSLTPVELEYVKGMFEKTGKPSTCIRTMATIEKGIRGRPVLSPLAISEISVEAIRKSVGLK